MVIVKDLSRFGRGWLDVGLYMDRLFVEKDVRFIAVQDNVDTAHGDNDFVPIMNYFNEFYLKNTSKKIRAVFQAKGRSGQRLAAIPPYGYRKNPDNSKQLIIDIESASVVQYIFQLAVGGYGPTQIARIINAQHILNPSAYKYENGIMNKPHPYRDAYFWNMTTIKKILDAPEYIGHTINFKTYSKSYKDNKTRENPPENQLVFKNTHPAIIDIGTWEIVRKMRESKHRPTRYGVSGLFSGVVFCSDCGSKLYFHYSRIINKRQNITFLKGSYWCSHYSKDYLRENNQACTAHYITELSLESLVISELNDMLSYVSQNESQFAKRVMDKSTQEQQQIIINKKKTLDKNQKRINELDMLIKRIYEDNVIGRISNERYDMMLTSFESEQTSLKELVYMMENEIRSLEYEAVNVDRFLSAVRKYTKIEKLTPTIVHEFVDRILVFEPEQARGNRRQKVEIVYKNVGKVDF